MGGAGGLGRGERQWVELIPTTEAPEDVVVEIMELAVR